VQLVKEASRCAGRTPAPLALAWVLAQGEDVVPTPGTRRCAHLEENLAALEVALSPADVARHSAALPPGTARGERFPASAVAAMDR
jgi:aryl-alcohol dehydrogenase-like predicted oxidoreductase